MDVGEFGSRLGRLREERGLSQAALGKASGIDQSHLSKLERGTLLPTREHAETLAEVFGVRIAWLLYGEGQPWQEFGEVSSLELVREIIRRMRTLEEALERQAAEPSDQRAQQKEMLVDVNRIADEILTPPPPAKAKKRA